MAIVHAGQEEAQDSREPRSKVAGAAILRVVIDPFVHAIMEKDRCLVEAALLSEKRIASLDDSVRTHFRNYRDSLPELKSICWVNPGDTDEDLCYWLRAGAPIERSRTLGYLVHRLEE
jgi:hypothetical protein